jgi:hypothetical protein
MSDDRQRRRVRLVAAMLVVAAAAFARPVGGQAPDAGALATVRPDDDGRALVNPGMGWVLHYYDNSLERYGSHLALDDALPDFPGLAVVYFRLAWSYLEPEEGRFDWSLIDGPAQRWIARGKKIALRFTCAEGEPGVGTPLWVREKGAKGFFFESGKGVVPEAPGRPWEPDYDDPVFLAALDRFLAAAGARFDGDPDVAFVDVGSFGIWGEGHTFWSTKRPYSAQTVIRHVDLWRAHFKKTLLVANDDWADHGRGPESLDYAAKAGLGFRDDSILVEPPPRSYLSADEAQAFWPHAPVILESEHYGSSKERGAWGDGSLYLEAIERYHASYASIHWWPREFLVENRRLVDRINRRLGYRIQLVEASWPEETTPGAEWTVLARWRNAGVAPCLVGGHPAFTLKEPGGTLVSVLVDDDFDVRSLPVDRPGAAPVVERRVTWRLPPEVRTGRYEVFVSVGSGIGTPRLALPPDGEDGHRRYRLGSLRVQGPTAEPQSEGDGGAR